jgi:putative DNA methylase
LLYNCCEFSILKEVTEISTATAIEGAFPFERLSQVAEAESWRKEIYRPIYYIHKWWARRLGSVFRAVILGASHLDEQDVMALFYKPVNLDGLVVFDPFMGSGTTVGEAYKLGCTVIGRDINPVAYRLVRTALSKLGRRRLLNLFAPLRERVSPELLELYRGLDSSGRVCDVLYFFWVKVLPCPSCRKTVDLFSTYVFAQHAYPKQYPGVHLVCPDCGQIFASSYGSESVKCTDCGLVFNPRQGAARRTKAICRSCGESFAIAEVALAQGRPPEHRMYAKLLLRRNGDKEYVRITADDLGAYQTAQSRLDKLNPPLPHVKILPGYNTQQVLNYGYQYWDEMFNARQILALSILASGIGELPPCPERDVLMLLFSGVLEFNNMFASYKGEGTGAVRHMFSHHILKPERMPIEANVWGTAKSSGSFSTLFKSRVLGAVDYKEAPFEISVEGLGKQKRSKKVFGVSPPIGSEVLDRYPAGGLEKGSVYLSCGSSSQTDLPTGSVNLIVTDPPFFDNVHYAELADFFYVWQRLYFGEPWLLKSETTRQAEEVQDADADAFARKLCNVFRECHRVLRDDGLLIFSYHHSRADGWSAVADAVIGSGFSFVQAQPVKAEMSGATPKSQAKSPIDLDVFLVCRKQSYDKRPRMAARDAFVKASLLASQKVERFNLSGRPLSENDVKVVFFSQLLVELSPGRQRDEFLSDFDGLISSGAQNPVEELWSAQLESLRTAREPAGLQLTLF